MRRAGRTATIWAVAFVALAMLVGGAACGDDDGGAPATSGAGPVVTLAQAGVSEKVRIEVAATSEQRQRGLMFRESMAEDAGMLFLFPRDTQIGFWMRNTKLPLDIAYISADGHVQEIRQARPLDETSLVPAAPYRYVLEVNQGWFERHRLGVGATVELPTGLPTPTE